MSNDFKLSGEVVKAFISIGPVARAMVLQGMKEYTKNTFGEEALELFGEYEIGSGSGSTGGSKTSVKKGKSSNGWDKTHCNTNITVEGDIASCSTPGYSGLASVMSELTFKIGEESALIEFEMQYSYTGLSGAGVCLENANVNDWIHLESSTGNGKTADAFGWNPVGSINDGFDGKLYPSPKTKILITKEKQIYYFSNGTIHSTQPCTFPNGSVARFYVTMYFAKNEIKSHSQTIIKNCPTDEEEIKKLLSK
eukprot:TRINITY_DN79_c0_g1_i1.p1 TRINITY_DN79_c0_g1~~TRINITY_DN79_c0_g1_i1.p1  ORF type:complete len:252 (-),score=74.69 TRINITY_DN79_c0_g1_i1:57-812(-)